MKNTGKKATIIVGNPMKRHLYDYYDRTIWMDDNGQLVVKMFGEFVPISEYENSKACRVKYW